MLLRTQPFCALILAISPPGQAEPNIREFVPGVRIHWNRPAVEIDATVVQNSGALELFACSKNTREHESIFVVDARPHDIHMALGLIGLQPGRPVRYDFEADKVIPPQGEPVKITVRLSQPGTAGSTSRKDRLVPAHELMQLTGSKAAPQIDWIYCGSRRFSDNRFGADADGTVICVVDFDTALVGVGELHSADNDKLWLQAATEKIPPKGTRCAILIEPAVRTINARIEPDATLRRGKKQIKASDIAAECGRIIKDGRGVRVHLVQPPNVGDDVAEKVKKRLIEAGVRRDAILVTPPAIETNMPRD